MTTHWSQELRASELVRPRPLSLAGYLARLGPGAPGTDLPRRGYRAQSKRREVRNVAEQRPTNERLADLLQEVVREVHDLKHAQNQLAADVQKLTESARS